jgi:hypothetical protein
MTTFSGGKDNFAADRAAAAKIIQAAPRQLSGKLRELRFYCGGERIRISYWIASGRRIIALTVFAKTKMRETAEIARAAAAMAQCQQEGHTAEEEG